MANVFENAWEEAKRLPPWAWVALAIVLFVFARGFLGHAASSAGSAITGATGGGGGAGWPGGSDGTGTGGTGTGGTGTGGTGTGGTGTGGTGTSGNGTGGNGTGGTSTMWYTLPSSMSGAQIAQALGVPWSDLAYDPYNNKQFPSFTAQGQNAILPAGTRIHIPGTGFGSSTSTQTRMGGPSTGAITTHTVRPGESLVDVAAMHRTSWQALYQNNRGTIESTAKAHGFADSDHGHWLFPKTVLNI